MRAVCCEGRVDQRSETLRLGLGQAAQSRYNNGNSKRGTIVTEPRVQEQTRKFKYLATPSSLFTIAHPRRVFSQLNRHQRGTI